ncbi:MAG: biopolymer transport protein ExbD [Verrucomicrobiota bacterium]
MKFPRNARIIRGQLEVAPFAAIFFLLVLFLLAGSLVYTPGVHIQLPTANDLPGTDKPSVSVALDGNGRLFYQNRLIEENDLKNRLTRAVKSSGENLILVVQADKAASYEQIVHLALLARDAGISEALLATLPRPLASPKLSGPP